MRKLSLFKIKLGGHKDLSKYRGKQKLNVYTILAAKVSHKSEIKQTQW